MEEKNNIIKKVIFVVNIGSALLLIGFSVASLIFSTLQVLTSFKIFLLFSPLFMAAFGIMMLAAELKIKFILKRVGFLRSMIGRGLFNIYLSSVVYYYFESSDSTILAWVSAISLFAVGIFYLFIHCFLPKNNQQNPLVANEEDDTKPYKERLF